MVSQKQAKEEIFARLRSGELKAQGVLCNPSNGEPVSCTAQAIPACDWVYLRLGLLPPQFNGRYVAFFFEDKVEDHFKNKPLFERNDIPSRRRINDFPSWRHIVCPSEVVRQLWPAKPGTAKSLSDREQAARTFLEDWFKSGKPCRGAWSAAIRHVADTCCAHCSNPVEAAKKSTGKFITEEIERLRGRE